MKHVKKRSWEQRKSSQKILKGRHLDPTVHKVGMPIRPVISTIASPTYYLAIYSKEWFKATTQFTSSALLSDPVIWWVDSGRSEEPCSATWTSIGIRLRTSWTFWKFAWSTTCACSMTGSSGSLGTWRYLSGPRWSHWWVNYSWNLGRAGDVSYWFRYVDDVICLWEAQTRHSKSFCWMQTAVTKISSSKGNRRLKN